MKILSIGDIHGRDSWKFMTHDSPYEYNIWRIAVDNGGDPLSFWEALPYHQYDKIIFVGDYVDSFKVGNVEMKSNLSDIIHLKRVLGDKVVLLLGNHDISYIVPNQWCSGYRPEMKHDFYQLFSENLELFKIAHEETDSSGGKWIWTHAGVTSGWYKELLDSMFNPRYRFAELIKEFDPSTKSVSEILNKAWELRMDTLFNVDSYSGGMSSWAGPIWVRPPMLNYWPMEGYNQIVGHTPQGDIWVVDADPDGEMYNNFKHHFIDCLEYGSENPLVLELL